MMIHAVATHPRSRTLHLHLLCGFLWTKCQALCFYGKALSMMEFLVDVFFTTSTCRLSLHVYKHAVLTKNHSHSHWYNCDV